ncbi:MAG: PEP-CTERM sorting domain-containing protein [Aureliella sp.]
MRVFTGLTTVLAFSWLCLGLASNSQAGLTLKYDPAGLNLAAAGPLTAQIDVLVNWDGVDSNTFSGLDFDVTSPAGVRLLDNPTPSNPLNFQFATVGGGIASFVSFGGNVAPLVAGTDITLTTLSFEVTPVAGNFPLGLTVTYGQVGAGAGIQEITTQFSSLPGNLVVGVPEPSSFVLLLGAASLAGFKRRRRRIG